MSVLLCSVLDNLILVVLKVILHFYYNARHVGGNETLKAYPWRIFCGSFVSYFAATKLILGKIGIKKCNQEEESNSLFLMVYKLVLLKYR